MGGSKYGESASSSGGKHHKNHIKLAERERGRELLANKAFDLVMGLGEGLLAVSINP